MQPNGFRPFWAITKHADILEIERQSDRFISSARTYLAPIASEEWLQSTVGDTHLFRTLVDIDDPQHAKLRQITQSWFMPPNLQLMQGRIAEIARAHVDRMAALGGACDFVKEVAVWYPLRVIMELLGVPPEDEPFMLRLTQEVFGPDDPDVRAGSTRVREEHGGVDLVQTAAELFRYFGALTADRRAYPRDDLATVIATGQLDGAAIPDREAMSYYVIIATAGHDTTSSVAAGGLLALLQNPGELARLRSDLSLLPNAVEEMIRWVSPVKHFMRTATEEYRLRGRTIAKGDAVALFYWSGNRDEDVFDDPFAFRIARDEKKHVAFGHGVHLCLGMHLARMEIKALFAELLPRLSEIELAGPPLHARSNFVSGLKSLPIRYRMV
jgi:cytochrome P450